MRKKGEEVGKMRNGKKKIKRRQEERQKWTRKNKNDCQSYQLYFIFRWKRKHVSQPSKFLSTSDLRKGQFAALAEKNLNTDRVAFFEVSV